MKTGGFTRFWAVLMTLVVIAAAILAAVWFTDGTLTYNKNKVQDETETDAETVAVTEDGTELGSGDTLPMQDMIFKSAKTLAAGEDAQNEEYASVTLTVTVEPESATNKEVDWTVSWVDANDEWVAGKEVTDYVTVTPESDGATKASVQCKKDFGSQIKITVTSRDNPTVKDECTVDFARRILDFRLYSYQTEEFLSSFGSSDVMIDMVIPNTFEQFQEAYSNEQVWVGNYGYIKSDWGSLDDEDLKDPEVAWADPYIAATFQFSEYTIKDMIPMEGTEGTLTATLEVQTALNKDFWGIFFDFYRPKSGYSATDFTYSNFFGENYERFSIGNNPLAIMVKNCIKVVDFGTNSEQQYLNYMSECINWLKEIQDEPLAAITYTFTGKYSTFSKTFSFSYNPETVKMPVSNITLDKTEATI